MRMITFSGVLLACYVCVRIGAYDNNLIVPDESVISSMIRGSYKSKELIEKTLRTPRWRKISQASGKEDIWLYEHYFYGITNGVIVESGAGNGFTDSVSYFFEKFMGWSSILIEPEKRSFSQLTTNRTNSIRANIGLCDKPRMLHFSSSVQPHMHGYVELMPQKYKRKYHAGIITGDLEPSTCVPLQSIVDQLGINKIDVWVLDVEGAEEVALRGLDFDKVNVSAVVIDTESTDTPRDTRKLEYMRMRGFRCSVIKLNIVCFNKSFRRNVSNKLKFS
mmetsp:Transcript_9938/g.14977  ORF Transcript_9938/g.14977 Transcript_9938/m.14977 type:complete len:277 (+) Transcript_9938:94-924(+)